MTNDQRQPMRISVLGMEQRAIETLKMYFQGPCKNGATIVDIKEGEASMIDMDGVNSKKLLAQHQQEYPNRPIIYLSLVTQIGTNVLSIKKPIQAEKMVTVLKQVRDVLNGKQKPAVGSKAPGPKVAQPADAPKALKAKAPKPETPKLVATEKQAKPTGGTHKTAMLLDDNEYKAYIGSNSDIDPTDPEQVKVAHFNPKEFLQDYVQRACKLALSKHRILRVETGWKPITIFPHTREVWIDAEDVQLRAACRVSFNRIANVDANPGAKKSEITISAVNGDTIGKVDPKKFQLMDAFLWKVALWTSQGRVPDEIDLDRPVFLRQWPNMTRLVIIPHALRIAALMMERPRSLLQITEELQIQQQYVFAFFSAAYALGLVNQTKLMPAKTLRESSVPSPKRSGLLSKVLGKLRA